MGPPTTRQCTPARLAFSLFVAGAVWLLFDLGASRPAEVVAARGKGRLVWSDEFGGDEVDRSRWNVIRSVNGGGNGEFQEYTDDGETVAVGGGFLALTPALSTLPRKFLYNGTLDLGDCSDAWPGACTRTGTVNFPLPGVRSGKVTTQGKFAFTYGVLEARVRVPRGDWLWPAFWLLPEAPGDAGYGAWPRSGEIDVMEGRGNAEDWQMLGGDPNRRRLDEDPATWRYSDYGRNAFTSTVHCAGPASKDDFDMVKEVRSPASLADDDGFLVFGLRWTPDRVRTYYVDAATGRETTVVDWRGYGARPSCRGEYADAATPLAPYDGDFYVIFNLAVGGDCGGKDYYWGHDTPWAPANCPGKAQGLTSPACFLQAQDDWLPTWGADDQLLVDWVRVWDLPDAERQPPATTTSS